MENPSEDGPGYWLLPKDLSDLHDEVIEYSVLVQTGAARKQEEKQHFPLTHSALSSMHLRAILIHRAVRTLCEFGWTPVAPILLRTLLDIIASCRALTVDGRNSEYMGFKYLGTSLIQFLIGPAMTPAQQQQNREQLENLLSALTPEDRSRAEQYIAGFTKPPAYWYNPEQASPAKILSTASPELQHAYRALSGSTHGGFIGSALFDDTPEAAQVNPREHPRRTQAAIVMSSRLLLDITYIRDVIEAIGSTDYYRHILNDLFLPLQASVGRE